MARKTRAQLEQEGVDRQTALDDAVTAKFAELMPQIAAELTKARDAAGTSIDMAPSPVNNELRAGDRALVEGLAMAMQRVADPGNKRRVINPEIMKQREEAVERMRALLIEFHATNRVPVYRVLNKVFLAETLIDPQFQDPKTKEMVDMEISWGQVPNQALQPVNDEAKAIHKEFLLSIGEVALDPSRLSAPWVMSAGVVLRGKNGMERQQVGAPSNADPRRMNVNGKAIRKTVNILGTSAEPAVMSA